jgi:serine/threonine protein kinase
MAPQDGQGRLIAGKYRLLEQVGEGGMAVVYRAEMRGAAGFARTVAIKKMKAELRSGQNYVAMFVEEARVGAELAHPNIVQVLDFCEDSDGLYCLVMEWVEGMDCRGLLNFARAEGQKLPWGLVAAIALGALRGLAAAHERKTAVGAPAPVIHRDISPANILVGANGVVKLADFGLARARDRMTSLTAPGIIKGKLAYIAPEIARGKPASAQSDLFAMGCVLWEGLAGRPLFDGTDVDLFRKVHKGQVLPLFAEREDLPPRLIEIVHQGLAVEPQDRFRSAKEMADVLAGVMVAAGMPLDVQEVLARVVFQVREARVTTRREAEPGHTDEVVSMEEVHNTAQPPPSPKGPPSRQQPPATPPSVPPRSVKPR